MDAEELLKKIEELRDELEKLARTKGVNDLEVIQNGKKLNYYLNKYNRIRNE